MTFVGHPFDTVKVRLQTQSASNPTYCESFHPVSATIPWTSDSAYVSYIFETSNHTLLQLEQLIV